MKFLLKIFKKPDKNNYVPFGHILFLVLAFFTYAIGMAQFTINTENAPGNFTGNNGSGTATFNFTNNNSFDIIITDVSTVFTSTFNNAEAYLYTSATPITGAPGVISSASTMPWVQVANQQVNITSTSGQQPVLSNLNVIIPANTTVGMAVSVFSSGNSSGAMRYYTIPANSNFTYSAGGVDMQFSSTTAYGGTSYTAAASNSPRGFVGSISFIPGIPCTGTPTSGTATATSISFCETALELTGATVASGITYQWQESPAGANTFTDIAGATNLVYNVSNLFSDTDYRCIVTCSLSSNSDTSNVLSVSAMGSSNFSEDFDAVSVGSSSSPSLPACWSYIDDVVSTGYGYTIASTPLSGSNTFRLYRTNSSTNASQDLVLISPETNNLGNGTKQLRFYLRSYSTTTYINQLEVLSMPDNTTTAEATVLTTINTTQNDQTWQEYIVPLPATTDDFFGFRLAYNGVTTASSVIIDDVFYEDLDTCAPPTGITISNIGQTTADLSWTASSSTGVTQYEYEIRASGAPGSGPLGLGASGTVTGTTASATGLSASVSYSVYVRSLCGTTPGRWTHIPEQFNTLCGVVTGTFYEDFDSVDTGGSTNPTVPNCWTYLRNSSVTTLYGYTTTSAGQTGKGFYTYRSAAGDGDLFLISPETNNLGAGTRQVRFSARVSSTTYIPRQKLEVYTMSDNTATANKTLVQGNIPLTATWQEFIVPLPNTTDDYFMFSFEREGGLSYIYLDDVYYEDLSPCMFPGNISVSNIKGTTAMISWDPSLATGVTGYEYEIRNANDSIVRTGTVAAPATSVNVTGLTEATEYTAYVRSVCGTTSGIWTTFPVHFMTDCPTYNYIYENFDSTSTGSSSNPSLPICWSYIDDVASTGYGYTIASTPQSTPNTFRLYRTNSPTNAPQELVLVSPPTDSLGGGTKQVRFSVRSYATTTYLSHLEVLSMPSNTSTAGATVLSTIVNNNDRVWTEYTVALPATTNRYFGFRLAYNGVTTASSLVLDDIYYEDIPAPTIDTITFVGNACFTDTSGSATVEVIGGVPPLTYQWLPSGGTSSTADSLAAGIYTVTVTDAKNRSVTDTVTISSPDEILIDFDYSDISCHGETNGWASVNPSGGVGPYTVLWSTNDSTDTINSLIAGHYSVTVTDSTGCIVTKDFDVIEPAILSAAISSSNVSITGGNNGSATVSVSGGTAPYSYLWTPSGQTTDTASNLTAGTYVVDITDAMGCTTQETVVITEPIPLTITLVSQKDILCNGDANGEITVDVSGDYPPYTYNWSPNVGNGATVSNLSAGIYTLTVTDAINDTTTETFTIVEPDPLVVTPGLVQGVSCFGSNDGSATVIVSGGVTPYSYLWSSGETTSSAINLSAGNNIVQITDANGCQVQQSFVISEPSEILIDPINITHVSCNGQTDGSITISVTGGTPPFSYSWSNGQLTQNLTNIQGGSYTITVTDVNGCVSTKTFSVINPGVVYPPTANNQGFCSDNNPQVSDLVATGTGVIKWYSSATGGTELAPNTALVNGQTYYASQTIANCESASRAAVLVSTSPSMQLVTTTLNVCNNSRIQDVTIDGLDHTQLKWYTSATTPIALGSNALLSSTTYYVSSFMNNTCESSRYAIQVTVLPITPAPSVSVQQLCGSGHTIDDLNSSTNVPGATLSWYATPQATTPLAGTAMVYSGTYYVEQVVNSCASARVAVSVQIIPTAAPFISNISVCSGTTISDYNAKVAVNYVWFTDPTTSVSLGGNTPITSGTYYIAQETSGCVSNRAQVSVVAHQVPNSPTGQQVQTFNFAATIANLQMNEAGVLWFGNQLDAGSLSNPLAANTPLVDKAKYYGVLVGGGNCASLPTEVEVVINLSTQGLDLTALSYYPNPTEDILNISYAEAITQVEVYSISGQKVLSQEFDSKDVKIDLTGVASGTYMVKIATETASQYVKVVRK